MAKSEKLKLILKELENSTVEMSGSMFSPMVVDSENIDFQHNLPMDLMGFLLDHDYYSDVYIEPIFKGGKAFIFKDKGKLQVVCFNSEYKQVNPLTLPQKIELLDIEGDFLITGSIVSIENSVKILADDILLINDANIAYYCYEDRLEILKDFYRTKFSKLQNVVGLLNVERVDKSDVPNAIEKYYNSEECEGIILKRCGSMYETTKNNEDWFTIDFKKSGEKAITKGKKQTEEQDADVVAIAKSNNMVEIHKAKALDTQDEKQFVLGVVTEPLYMDAEGEIMTPEAIEEMAHNYLKDRRHIGIIHKEFADAYLVESYIARADFELNGELVKKGSWIIGVIIEDKDLWEAVKLGLINGFSVGGFAKTKDLT